MVAGQGDRQERGDSDCRLDAQGEDSLCGHCRLCAWLASFAHAVPEVGQKMASKEASAMMQHSAACSAVAFDDAPRPPSNVTQSNGVGSVDGGMLGGHVWADVL